MLISMSILPSEHLISYRRLVYTTKVSVLKYFANSSTWMSTLFYLMVESVHVRTLRSLVCIQVEFHKTVMGLRKSSHNSSLSTHRICVIRQIGGNNALNLFKHSLLFDSSAYDFYHSLLKTSKNLATQDFGRVYIAFVGQ